ncbi:MAG: hypothetical protein R3321_13520 [Nitrososphaeraceae archaeon]|nr:hypothetical protein [Nitrososphaeraceae archaeon]
MKYSVYMVSILVGLFLAMATTVMSIDVHAQSSEQNEKLMECNNLKDKFIAEKPNAILINCEEYTSSDYNSVNEYLTKEHPELQLP